MLTGNVPFPVAEDLRRSCLAHISNAPPPVAGTRPELQAVDGVINRGMAKRADDRYSTAGEIGRGSLGRSEGASSGDIW